MGMVLFGRFSAIRDTLKKLYENGDLIMELFDSHAHYDDEKFNEDREEILREIYNSGVTKLISAGYSLESSKKAIELANTHGFVYATCGISPNDIPDTLEELQIQLNELEKLVTENLKTEKRIVAIGEIGLDYYWNTENKDLQKTAFIEQIKIANKYDLPIVIHTRDAVMDTLDILKNIQPTIKPGMFHCCPLNPELVKEALKLDFYISFCGPVTFKNSKNASQVVELVPFNRMLIETDSPYLSPEPNRGRRNDSRNVRYIAEKVAEFKGVSAEEIAKYTYQNAEKLFNEKGRAFFIKI